jgi:hypothetical protein
VRDLGVAPGLVGDRHPKDAYGAGPRREGRRGPERGAVLPCHERGAHCSTPPPFPNQPALHPRRCRAVEALTGETWVWGLLPHGGPCPLPGGTSCASSLMAHTASGSRCPVPQRLTAAGGGGGRGSGGGSGASSGGSGPPSPRAAGAGEGAEGEARAPAAAGPAAPRAVAAGEDFFVVAGAGGGVWDSRAAAKHRHPGVKLGDVRAALRGRVVAAVAAGARAGGQSTVEGAAAAPLAAPRAPCLRPRPAFADARGFCRPLLHLQASTTRWR